MAFSKPGGKKHGDSSIDARLIGSQGKAAYRQIEFHAARQPDRGYAAMKAQYVPLNSQLRTASSSGHLLSQKSTSSVSGAARSSTPIRAPTSSSFPLSQSAPSLDRPSDSKQQSLTSPIKPSVRVLKATSQSTTTSTTPSTTSSKTPSRSSSPSPSASSSSSPSSSSKPAHPTPEKPALFSLPVDSYLFSRDRLVTLLEKELPVKEIGAGLRNLGNTCFLNASLQCLVHLAPLANYLLSRHHSRTCTAKSFCALCMMEKHASFALDGQKQIISPDGIVRNLPLIERSLRRGRQEDAHEFLRGLISKMQKASKPSSIKDNDCRSQTSAISQLLGGQLLSEVQCALCKYRSCTYDEFLDLSIDVNGSSVQRCLDGFFKSEQLDAKNQYRCEKCRKNSRASKRFAIATAPPVLSLHLKRFNIFGKKINKTIEFAPVLRVKTETTSSPIPYDLSAILVHSGSSAQCGHYYSYVRSPHGQWYRMDDSTVSRVHFGTVQREQPYILFYTIPTKAIRQFFAPSLQIGTPPPSLSSSAAAAAVASPRPSPSSSSASASDDRVDQKSLPLKNGSTEKKQQQSLATTNDSSDDDAEDDNSSRGQSTDPSWRCDQLAQIEKEARPPAPVPPELRFKPRQLTAAERSADATHVSVCTHESWSLTSCFDAQQSANDEEANDEAGKPETSLANNGEIDEDAIKHKSAEKTKKFIGFVSDTIYQSRVGQFPVAVATWEGSEEGVELRKETLKTDPNLRTQRSKRTAYDIEYDRGKQKKVGKHIDPFAKPNHLNHFQKVHDRRIERGDAPFPEHKQKHKRDNGKKKFSNRPAKRHRF